MGSVLAIISKAAFGKLRTREGGVPAIGTILDTNRYDSAHPTLESLKAGGALFLVTVRPSDTLWLAAAFGAPSRHNGGWRCQANLCPVVDVTRLCNELGLERGDGKLALRLQTPRVLDQRAEAILRHVETAAWEAFKRDKPYALKVPKSILSLPAIPAPRAAPTPKRVAGGRLPPLAGSLGELCLAAINGVIDDLRENPVRVLKRKPAFTNGMKNIFAGKVDAAEVTRMLRKELEHFVDDATRAAMKKPKGDLDAYFGKLVDTVAIRAIEALCRGIVAEAIDRLDLFPHVAGWYGDAVPHYAKYVKALLGRETKRPAKPKKEKKPSKPKQRLAKGAFAFVNFRRLDADAVVAETTIHQAQFIEAMAMYSGERAATAAKTLDAYLKREKLERGDFYIELYDVIEGGRAKPRFEYWMQGAGDGMIFNYGTDESPNSIGSTQHSFECHGSDDDESAALVQALQAGADRSGL